MDFGLVGFREPLWLAVGLGLVALLWSAASPRSALSAGRQRVVFAIRSLVVLLAAAALAEIEWIRTTDRTAVIFLLDQSRSVPSELRAAQTTFVNEAMSKRRPQDLAGAIVFGGRAEVEVPPWEHGWRLGASLDRMRYIDPDQTDLAAAVKLASASFPPDAARRIVLVCDGLENRGQTLPLAEAAAAQGVGFDVVEVGRTGLTDVLVESVQAPSVVRAKQPFDVRIVVDHVVGAGQPETITGRLVASVRSAGKTIVLNPGADLPISQGGQRVTLPAGKTPLVLSTALDQAGMYPFRVEFTPDAGAADEFVENNAATTLVDVPGNARVLIVERDASDDEQEVAEHRAFTERLRRQGLEIDERPASSAFQSIIDLQPYDCVVLADVPRDQLSEGQVRALVQNVHDSGGGLLMLGGPNSLGAGGWAGSELEKASPVDFQIQNAVVAPVGALQLVIDRSGSMTGDKLTWAKAAAVAAVEVLGERDTVGVVSFDSEAQWNARPTPLKNRAAVIQAIRRIAPGGGTDLWPAMTEARQAMKGVNASVKHMIVLTDGQTAPNNFAVLASQLRQEKVTV
ncbi:MAG TPA: VWA domain-containing protein, partial [Pirellulales bacterium]